MDNIKMLLTTTEGRIGVRDWWVGMLILSVLGFIPNIILMFAFGQRLPVVFVGGSVVVSLVIIWFAYCMGIKRRHDRGSAGSDLKLLLAAIVVGQLVQAPRTLEVLSGDLGAGRPAPELWMQIIGFVLSIFGLYVFIQLGFLKGTTGPNSYGPDPLDGATRTEPELS